MTTVSNRVGHAETSKNEDTWCGMLCDFRSLIIFNSESIQGVVEHKAFRAIPMVIRTCSMRIATMTALGLTRLMTSLTIGGIATMVLLSLPLKSLYFLSFIFEESFSL